MSDILPRRAGLHGGTHPAEAHMSSNPGSVNSLTALLLGRNTETIISSMVFDLVQ